MSTLSTHVLDSATGRPAVGMTVTLEVAAGVDQVVGPLWRQVGFGKTDPDGRLSTWDLGLTGPGRYRLTFDTASWFAARERECFYPEVLITFTVKPDDAHYHVPLLLAPFAYSTYRGS